MGVVLYQGAAEEVFLTQEICPKFEEHTRHTGMFLPKFSYGSARVDHSRIELEWVECVCSIVETAVFASSRSAVGQFAFGC